MTNLPMLDIQGVSNGIRNGNFTVEEYITSLLDRIEKIDEKINAFITINKNAINQAKEIDKKKWEENFEKTCVVERQWN